MTLFVLFFKISLFSEEKRKSKIALKYKKALLDAGNFDMLHVKAFESVVPDKNIIEQLAEKGYAPAEYTLGVWYTQDYPYKKDLDTAKHFLTRAANHGSYPAKELLSKL